MQDRIIELQKAIQDGKLDELKPLKKIDFSSGKFEANGETYYLETTLTIGRYCEFQILEQEMAVGLTLKDVFNKLVELDKLMNQMRFTDSAVALRAIMTRCTNLMQKEPFALKLCTLFINTKDEDRGKWGNDVVVKKLENWKEEKIDVADFFAYALTLAPTFINLYNQFTQNTLELFGGSVEIVNALTANQPK